MKLLLLVILADKRPLFGQAVIYIEFIRSFPTAREESGTQTRGYEWSSDISLIIINMNYFWWDIRNDLRWLVAGVVKDPEIRSRMTFSGCPKAHVIIFPRNLNYSYF